MTWNLDTLNYGFLHGLLSRQMDVERQRLLQNGAQRENSVTLLGQPECALPATC